METFWLTNQNISFISVFVSKGDKTMINVKKEKAIGGDRVTITMPARHAWALLNHLDNESGSWAQLHDIESALADKLIVEGDDDA